MIKTPDFQPCQTGHSQAHKRRSAGVSFGRFTERCRTPIWWPGRESPTREGHGLRNEAASKAMSVVNKCPSGNE
jgi:hypothetical protein